MTTDIYLSFHLAELDRTLVVEGDGFSVWAYLLNDDDESIDFSGFLCSTGTLVDTDEEVERFIKEGNQPPLLRVFANDLSVINDLSSEDISVDALDDESLAVSIRGKQYLLMDMADKQAYSIAVAQDGPYAYMLEAGTQDEEGEEE